MPTPVSPLNQLSVVSLYLTDGCNSRCKTCDIWKAPRKNMSMKLVKSLADDFQNLGVELVVLSGGEAMQHPEWPEIASLFRKNGIFVLLLTNGILLQKQAEHVIRTVDSVTISLDSVDRKTYQEIRGIDALPILLKGMKTVAEAGIPIRTRTTIQQMNFREIPEIIDTALKYGAGSVSFLAVDVANAEAFGREVTSSSNEPHSPPLLALSQEELPELENILDQLQKSHKKQFKDKKIVETPEKLRRVLYDYFSAVNGLQPFQGPLCNAPHVSAVIEVDGRIRPCFFLPSGAKVGKIPLAQALNQPKMLDLRRAFDQDKLQECKRCVCPLYRAQ